MLVFDTLNVLKVSFCVCIIENPIMRITSFPIVILFFGSIFSTGIPANRVNLAWLWNHD